MLNKAIIQGRLTKDVDLRYTSNQTPVASFTLAVERSNSKEKTTDFIDVVAWKGSAEFVSKYFHKGDMALVEGRVQIRDWTDNNNNKRRNTEIIANSIYFCGGKKSDSSKEETYEEPTFEEVTEDEDGLPF